MRLAVLLALALCTSCVSFTYERDLEFEPVRASQVEALRVGESDIAEALSRLGAPLYVWEGVDQAIVLAYGWSTSRGWDVRVSRSNLSFRYDDAAARLEGWVLVFDGDGKLKIARSGLLRDLRDATRRPPAPVE